MRCVMRLGLAWGLVAASGCATMAKAVVNHNSRGSTCIQTPTFAIIDFLIAGAGVAAFAAENDDESVAWLLVPGVFAASGVVGTVSAARCQPHEATGMVPIPASNTAPSFGEAEVDPDVPDATLEDMGVAPSPPAPAAPPTLRVERGDDVGKPSPSAPDAPPTPAKIQCSGPLGVCPVDHACALTGADAGSCIPDRDR